MNPYWGANFVEFFGIFFLRVGQWMRGKLSIQDMVSDEIQIFVLLFIAIASSLVGTFLILKKMTMLANSLSHTILLGIVIAYILTLSSPKAMGIHIDISLKILLIAAAITALVTTLLSEFFSHFLKLQEDASVGLVFTMLFALGIVLVTLFTRSTHIGTEIIMGNIDALHFNDLKLVLYVAIGCGGVIWLFFKPLQLVTFDAGLAASLGYSARLFGYLLMVLTAACSIAAFRAVGVLLFLAFLVGPPLTARLLTDRLERILLYGIVIGVFSAFFGVALSRHFLSVYQMALSTSGLLVLVLGIWFLFAATVFRLRSRGRRSRIGM